MWDTAGLGGAWSSAGLNKDKRVVKPADSIRETKPADPIRETKSADAVRETPARFPEWFAIALLPIEKQGREYRN